MKNISFTIMAALFYLAACSTEKSDNQQKPVSMKPIDPHSYARPQEVAITHLNWQAAVDFDRQQIAATATYELNRQAPDTPLVLDVNGLDIHSVSDQDGQPLTYTLGDAQPFIGRPLSIDLHDSTTHVSITYTTGPQAAALQWLQPQQTAAEKKPFLFTQSQAILCRTWIPIQDSPGIRFTYEARVQVPAGMLALMSATNPRQMSEDGVYTFSMPQPIPAYLMALAAGDIAYEATGPRTGVYAEPPLLKKAAWEFAGMEDKVTAAEQLYGPYRWQVYDLIVLPPSFPFGGMENPRLTFATPTILAGDRSLTSLVAHELAHSWSGNLVTNATWNDFWLNEGFTVYFEQRIMEALFGRDYSEMLATLALQDLKATIADLEAKGQQADTHLKLDLAGRDPDDGMTDIAYNKGYFFLRLLEERFGRGVFDAFLKQYFAENAFQSMTTEGFLAYLSEHLFKAQGVPVDEDLYQRWVYGPGLPDDCPQPVSDRFARVDSVLQDWQRGTPVTRLISQEDLFTKKWSTHEWLHFLRHLPDDMTIEQMKELDDYLQFTYSGNAEILAAWFVHVIRPQYKPGYQNLENFLITVGRRKFLVPLYTELAKTPQGLAMARSIYAKARPNYHYVSVNTIDELLNWQDEGRPAS